MNEIALGWVSWLIRASWHGAVLVVIVLLVQFVAGRRLSSRWRCALWWLVLVRLVMPIRVDSSLSLFNFEFLTPPTILPSQPSTAHVSVLPWLAWIWAAGAILMAIRILREHLSLRQALIRRRLVTEAAVLETLEDCKVLTRVHAPVVVMETDRVKSPALFGFIRPRLLLPAGLLNSFSPEDLRHIFIHELCHLRRQDIVVGWLLALVLTLHWFNPFVWIALLRWRADRELATDELALHHLELRQSRDYGATILKLLQDYSRPVPLPAVAGILEDCRQVVTRIRQIAGFGQTPRSQGLGAMIFLVLVVVAWTDAQLPAASAIEPNQTATAPAN